MTIKGLITKEVVYVLLDIIVAHTTDTMKRQDLRRLPVIGNDKLVRIVTERTMAEASPSKVMTLLICKTSYLLNRTKIRDVMVRDVMTVSSYTGLEDAIYTMMKNRIGIIPVIENGRVHGVITSKDVFKAFFEISGYNEEGIRVAISADDTAGTLARIVDTISNDNLNIKHTVAVTRKSGRVAIEVQIDGKADVTDLREKLLNQGIQVDVIELVKTKSLD